MVIYRHTDEKYHSTDRKMGIWDKLEMKRRNNKKTNRLHSVQIQRCSENAWDFFLNQVLVRLPEKHAVAKEVKISSAFPSLTEI